jgi:acyl-homoserine lactone synthase
MVEIHVVQHDNSHLYADELEQYFRARYQVYVLERGWKALDRPDGREIDQFDTAAATHLLALEKGRVVGGHRFNPSTGPTLLNEVFPQLSLLPLARSPDVYETTRLWVAKEQRGRYAHPSVESLLLAGTMEFALALKLRHIRVIFETWWLSRFQSIGWKLHPLGVPLDINGLNCVAVLKDVSEAIWMETCMRRSVAGPVLIWNGTARPSYQLPELLPAVA